VLGLAGLAALLTRLVGGYPTTARRLTADVRLLLGANPDHRVEESGPAELRQLAGAVDELARRRREAECEVAREVAAARADVEQERNRLAALMADLTVAVLVCSAGGRVLLYNSAARALLGDDPALGLGRSVFGIVDRALVAHALERIGSGDAPAYTSTALRDGQVLQVSLAPVRSAQQETGFVLVLEDMTDQLGASRRRDALLRGVTESTRASLASIRAAVEAVLDYPDMEPDERKQFVEIVLEESQRLGEQVEGWVAEAGTLGGDGLLSDIRGDDLVTMVAQELERECGLSVSTTRPSAGDLWLRVDSHAVVSALGHLAARLRQECGVTALTLSLAPGGRHAKLDARWRGDPPDGEALKVWFEEPLPGRAAASVRDVVDRHDADVWSGSAPDGWAYLRLLLPVTEAAEPASVQGHVDLDSRPEFYDFDLFDVAQQSEAWHDRKLADLAYTVFDTETTGFHPDQGDEIVSIGAVRVVNGRLLRNEVFERLVDPQRSVPAASSAVHGITTELVQGEPPLEEVLPLFARFAEDTVLVGHNVGFDMSFLRAREERTGVHLGQPVLDTLLLDAAVHPDHESHSLEAIAARLGVDVTGRHTALGDALVTGEVFVRLLALLKQQGICTLGEALAASQETYQARLDAQLYGG
ncbi:MAG: exonuclease domain-containing protein, partial [Actinomycetota bacterium]|nr:exonuclease domain-containing protein [Actinomycetota bacterium]